MNRRCAGARPGFVGWAWARDNGRYMGRRSAPLPTGGVAVIGGLRAESAPEQKRTASGALILLRHKIRRTAIGYFGARICALSPCGPANWPARGHDKRSTKLGWVRGHGRARASPPNP